MATALRNIRISDDLWEHAARVARARDETLSDIVRASLTRYVNRHGDKVNNGFENAETEAFMRNWENDETLYRATLAYARDQKSATPQTIARNVRDGIINHAVYRNGSSHPMRAYLSGVDPQTWENILDEVTDASEQARFPSAMNLVSETTIAEAITDALDDE